VKKIRKLLSLDSFELKWKRAPWVKMVSLEEFEEKVN
jgi:hypothetical protein